MGPKNRRETLGLGGLLKQSLEDTSLDMPLPSGKAKTSPRLAAVSNPVLADDVECLQCGAPLLTPTTPCPKCAPNNAKQASITTLSSEPVTGTKSSSSIFASAMTPQMAPQVQPQADLLNKPSLPPVETLQDEAMYLNLPSNPQASAARVTQPVQASQPPSITDTLLTLSMGFVGLCVMALGVAQFLIEDPGVGSVAHGLQSIAVGLTVLGVRRVILNSNRG